MGGGALLVTGVVVLSNNIKHEPATEHNEGSGMVGAVGAVMVAGGVGMITPGIIVWSKGAKRYKAYQQLDTSLEITPANLGLRYRF
jgi:hypothetical protein